MGYVAERAGGIEEVLERSRVDDAIELAGQPAWHVLVQIDAIVRHLAVGQVEDADLGRHSSVALALRDVLSERGAAVIMTRSTDTLIALNDRGRIANAKKGDVFVSIHVNAANPRWKQPGAARGFETYFLSEARTEDARRVEAMENEVVKYEIANNVAANDPLSFIVHDMEQNQHLRESSELAATVQRSLAKMHPGPNRGVKQAGFRVLVTAFMPAVLVEIGFGTNEAEARYLRDPRRQREIATSIADATMQYLAAYQRRTSATGQ